MAVLEILVVRSLIAVFTSGATLPALNDKQVSDNIVKAAAYTLQLGIDPPIFPPLPMPSRPFRDPPQMFWSRGARLMRANAAGAMDTPNPAAAGPIQALTQMHLR